jgi:signal transduction histidine kinase
VLVQEAEELFGVLAVHPVYTSVDGRRELRGFASGALRIGQIVDDALIRMDPRSVRVLVRDQSAPESESLLYVRGGSQEERAAPGEAEVRTRDEHTLTFGGRTWSVSCQPTAAYFSERRSWQQTTALIGGSTISLLLAALIVIISGETSRVEGKVEQRTAELWEANRMLETEISARKRTRETLRTMTSEVFLAEERERRKLAVDLHDDLGQLLPLVKMRVAILRDNPASAGLEGELSEVAGLLDQAGESLRSLIFQTMPPILHDLGLRPAIEWLVEDLWLRLGFRARLLEGPAIGELSEDVRIIVYRSVRELIINAAKHAEATQTTVAIERKNSTLRIVVEDDGRGFDSEADHTSAGMGFGLFSIRERLDHLGGALVIDSSAGRGTRATIELPVDTPAPSA